MDTSMPDDDSPYEDVIAGVLLGALVGAGLGLSAWIFVPDAPPFFAGGTILMVGIICGFLGYFFGAGFIDWLKENWWRFWS